ncbi:MAG: hypothetical protein H6617_03760 [Bdellovibrionaceae bacterium]|nr:hypothetical protein [Bdellovibrionales bacterium]MCB9253775.1 hypothetical protein [Pseudobdellovibrionaceae bacterium]
MRVLLIFCLFSATAFGYLDTIHDDYFEKETGGRLHSFGLMAFGAHNNTFHLRQFFARYNQQFEGIQFFLTLNGQKDTHDPATTYNYLLGNINLYDYGVDVDVYKGFFISPRGAATYRVNFHTYLLVPPQYYATNNAEFDAPSQFLPVFLTGPGIRLGYRNENFEIGYSQGDNRHSIPIAVMAKYQTEDLYLRGVAQFTNEDPTIYNSALWKAHVQLSLGVQYDWLGLKFAEIVEVSRIKNDWWVRLEQAVFYKEWSLAIREIVRTNQRLLFEGSIQRHFLGAASLGAYAATDGRAYLATQVNF